MSSRNLSFYYQRYFSKNSSTDFINYLWNDSVQAQELIRPIIVQGV